MPKQKIIRSKLFQVQKNQAFPRCILKSMKSGHCVGFGLLWLVGMGLKYLNEEDNESSLNEEVHDVDWFNEITNKIAQAEEKKLTKPNKDFIDFSQLLRLYHHPDYVLSDEEGMVPQSDLHRIYEDTKGRKISQVYTLAALMNCDELATILNQIIFNHELVLIESNDHAMAIFKHNEAYHFYNSNNKDVIIYHDEAALAKKIFHKFDFCIDDFSPIDFRIFSFHPGNYDYPDQNIILNEIGRHSRKNKHYAKGFTALHMAAITGCMNSVKFYLNNDLNKKNTYEETALHLAAGNGRLKIVNLLLKNHALITKTNRKESPLFFAAENGYNKIVRRLLEEEEIDINLQNEKNKTALMLAALNGHPETVKILCRAHAKVNLYDIDSKTALLYAIKAGDFSMVKTLLRYHADVSHQDKNGYNAFFYAAYGNYQLITEELLKYASKHHINQQSNTGTTALMVAVFKNNDALVRLLLKHGARPDLQDKWGRTAFDYAEITGNKRIKNLLTQNPIHRFKIWCLPHKNNKIDHKKSWYTRNNMFHDIFDEVKSISSPSTSTSSTSSSTSDAISISHSTSSIHSCDDNTIELSYSFSSS